MPGTVVSFRMAPEGVADKLRKNETLEINFRHLYKRMTGRKKSTSLATPILHGSPQPSRMGSSLGAANAGLLKSSNRFDSIIDKLERKYYHAVDVKGGDGDSEMDTSDAGDSHSSFSQMASPAINDGGDEEDGNSKRKKGKRKLPVVDVYDYSDPFIDDSEEVLEYEGLLAVKDKRAKKGGYFVSSGDVDVVESIEVSFPQTSSSSAPKLSSSSKATSKIGGSALPSPVGAPTTVQTKPTAAQLKAKAGALKANPAKPAIAAATSSSAVATQVAPTVSAPVANSIQVSDTNGSNGGSDSALNAVEKAAIESAKKPKAPPAPKPAWQPSEPAKAAMERFKELAEQNVVKTKSAAFPVSLEIPLLDLDAVVLAHHPAKELNKSTGYYEFIQTCLGSNFPVGRIRSTLTRLQARASSQKVKTRLDQLVSAFISELNESVVTCPADKRMPPSKSDANIDNVQSSQPSSVVERMEGASDEMAVVVDNVDASVCNDDVQTPSVIYDWYCKWTIPLRQKLVNIVDLVGEWVLTENEYRNRLTIVDKKEMRENEVIDLFTNKFSRCSNVRSLFFDASVVVQASCCE